jgi:hypothetical protein
MKETQFLAGVFFDFEVPKEKSFLFKYFRSPLEQQFVRYYLCFGEIEFFTEHTGHFCQKRWLKILKNRFDEINSLHDKYKADMELELLEKLEKGRYEF